MAGLRLYVYKLPEGKGAEFEARLPAAPGKTRTRVRIKDAAELLALLKKHESDGVWEGGPFVSLSAPEIVELCRALPNAISGPVTVSVNRL